MRYGSFGICGVHDCCATAEDVGTWSDCFPNGDASAEVGGVRGLSPCTAIFGLGLFRVVEVALLWAGAIQLGGSRGGLTSRSTLDGGLSTGPILLAFAHAVRTGLHRSLPPVQHTAWVSGGSVLVRFYRLPGIGGCRLVDICARIVVCDMTAPELLDALGQLVPPLLG